MMMHANSYYVQTLDSVHLPRSMLKTCMKYAQRAEAHVALTVTRLSIIAQCVRESTTVVRLVQLLDFKDHTQ
jgi:hypothetical protein